MICPAARNSYSGDCKHQAAVRQYRAAVVEAERLTRAVPGAVHRETNWRRCQRCPALIDPVMPGRHCDQCAEERLKMLEGED